MSANHPLLMFVITDKNGAVHEGKRPSEIEKPYSYVYLKLDGKEFHPKTPQDETVVGYESYLSVDMDLFSKKETNKWKIVSLFKSGNKQFTFIDKYYNVENVLINGH